MPIRENVQFARNKIAEACRRSGRKSEEIELVAITKTVDVEQINEAIEAGIRVVGENRVQEAWRKFQEVGEKVHWHMVGHLQTNKVKRVLQFADMIHSVDSVYLAREIQTQAKKLERTIEILIQVNTSGEESKFGLEPEATIGAIEEVSTLPNLKIKGLMTIGAFLPNPEDVRPCFKLLHDLKDRVNERGITSVEIGTLSMGMTNDYEIAIEEGSTMVRVGTAIFGERG
ncbi:YggS family pyridoxal phosphate-dependent enzyme [candidate division KSB1 bacterium]|nr:YggS family pyridoxal phosphate-dependent enzyme [candidate division KSB1 bacterium]MCH8871357.1 YggS family pyridoxal phosphate-dependent enzyme [candidate division KSB1 bacterium]MCH8954263.1 YggS family pyridoxal phosphate-dependent enzyme [candidate division KSB1 bacterium]